MKPSSIRILELFRMIAHNPSSYGNPYEASGMITALALVLLAEERDLPFATAARWARAIQEYVTLVAEATPEVERLPEHGISLCDERAEPSRVVSHDALKRHAEILLKLLEGRIQIGTYKR
jgi:hypothetical protein